MNRIIVTGGIGCGKSTVCRMLQQYLPNYSYVSYDSDITSVLWQQESILQEIKDAFGTTDKREVSNIVFGQEQQMQTLNVIFASAAYGLMFEKILENDKLIFEIPLLWEILSSNQLPQQVRKLLNAADAVTITIEASNMAERIKRIEGRDSCDQEKVERIISCQSTPIQRRTISEYCIDTAAHDINTLKECVRQLVEYLHTDQALAEVV